MVRVGGMPSARHEILPAAIILSDLIFKTGLELIINGGIINGSGRSIEYPAPINKLGLIIIKPR